LLAGCSRKLATRYFGWLFVASATERGIAVADLTEFRHATTIPLDFAPAQVIHVGAKVLVTCPEARTLIDLDLAHFKPGRKLVLPGKIVSAAGHPDGKSLILIIDQPSALVILDPVSLRVKKQIKLPAAPSGLALSDSMAAVTSAMGSVVRVSLPDCKMLGSTALDAKCGPIQFRKDGKMLLTGLPELNQIATIDAATGSLLARLPLAFPPARFINDNGGQMFVTAPVSASQDRIAIVSPYQSEVDQTIIAGRTPLGMAVSAKRNLLLVTNPGSGDLTILDIDTRGLAASVHVGGNPGEVLLTADEEYALVISQESGDVSVVRMNTVLDRSVKTKPLFTVFPMGGSPQSAVIVAKEA
jgi:YVTN family beta-propeller protein